MIDSKLILFSAIQPSGDLTLGNYIGTMRYWSRMQDQYKSIYCVADLHALTTLNTSMILKNSILDTLALYLSCGINPEKSIIFIQSQVYQHCQLNWILNCFSNFRELLRMNQFNTKTNIHSRIKKNVGLFNYPVLMASDILLYQANVVPVGQDQKQHLELVRHLAHRFNVLYGETFSIPVPLIYKYGSKIMSLLNPSKKMSKSDPIKNNVIFLLENPSSIFIKIKNSVTDSDYPAKILYDIKKKPGISNLLEILSGITEKEISDLEKEFDGVMYSEFKKIVAEQVSLFLLNLQKIYLHYRKNESFLIKIANEGAEKAKEQANKTLKRIYSKIGFFSYD